MKTKIKFINLIRFISKQQSWISLSLLLTIIISLYVLLFYIQTDILVLTWLNKDLILLLLAIFLAGFVQLCNKIYKYWAIKNELIERVLVFIMGNIDKDYYYYQTEYIFLTNKLKTYDLENHNDEIHNLLYIIENELWYCVYKNKKWRELLEAIIKNNLKRGSGDNIQQCHIDLFNKIKCNCIGIIPVENYILNILKEKHEDIKKDEINTNELLKKSNSQEANEIYESRKIKLKDSHKIKDAFFYDNIIKEIIRP